MTDAGDERPIGIFDSGVGGLSVVRHVQTQLPHESLVYLADQAHVPYGLRSAKTVRRFSVNITRFLMAQDAKLVVVACNTASAAALTTLRREFPQVVFVGMEPAVKPAARQTRSGRVGVLATASTFESQRYASLMQRFARHVTMFEDPCVGLVELIEAGKGDSLEATALLNRVLTPMLAQGVDTLVLGCTHYPFVISQIAAIAGPNVSIIDPAPAVARQAGRQLSDNGLLAPPEQNGRLSLWTTGDATAMAVQVDHLLGERAAVGTAVWDAGKLRTAS